MKAQHKAGKGSVGIESFQGRLRLRLPRQVYGGKQKYLTLGLENTPENRKEAEAKAWQIEKDILAGYFDPTLAKYRPQTHLTVVEAIKPVITLSELWDKYTEYRKPQIAETTLRIQYASVRNHINKLPTKDLKDAIKIRDFLVANLSSDAARRTLTQLSACCEWSCESSLASDNPFRGMAKKIKVVRDEEDTIDPFTTEERDTIIAAFEQHPYYSYYASFVKFLFMTGCRTGEAVGLKWKHISPDCKTITFCESVSSQLKIRKDCKTHKTRKFPCNNSLQALLLSIKSENCNPESLVFPSKRGIEIRSGHFIDNAWKGRSDRTDGIVMQLAKEGKVSRYRTQYNTRHTFITMALEAGVSVVQVAKWVGNSPEIIMKHYAGTIRQVQVPEF
jgi:integrase